MKMSHPIRTVRSVALISLLLPALEVAHGETRTFREGQDNGFGAYAGTADTWIASASSSGAGDETATNYGSASSLKVEDDPAQSDGQGLIRFDNIFGNGAGQIPLGSTINSATVSITTVNGGFASVPNAPGIHEMLVVLSNQPGYISIRTKRWLYIPAQGAGGFRGDKWNVHLISDVAAMKHTGQINSDIVDGRVKPNAPSVQLYDLSKDLGQTRNIAGEHPEVVKQLQARVDQAHQQSPDTKPIGWIQPLEKKKGK